MWAVEARSSTNPITLQMDSHGSPVVSRDSDSPLGSFVRSRSRYAHSSLFRSPHVLSRWRPWGVKQETTSHSLCLFDRSPPSCTCPSPSHRMCRVRLIFPMPRAKHNAAQCARRLDCLVRCEAVAHGSSIVTL